MTSYSLLAVKKAESQRGVKETSPNWGPEVKEYLKSTRITFPAAWCMAFVHWCFRVVGLNLRFVNPASVGFFAEWAARMGYLVTKAQRGDVVAFNFNADLWPDHVGFVRRAAFGLLYTVEGNTQPGTGGNQAEGGGVYFRVRRQSRVVLIRIPGVKPYQYALKQEERKIYLRSWILRKRREGKSWKWIKVQPYAKEYYEVLGGK